MLFHDIGKMAAGILIIIVVESRAPFEYEWGSPVARSWSQTEGRAKGRLGACGARPSGLE